jgi:hypothetical protein
LGATRKRRLNVQIAGEKRGSFQNWNGLRRELEGIKISLVKYV